jgi:hypothetical protein
MQACQHDVVYYVASALGLRQNVLECGVFRGLAAGHIIRHLASTPIALALLLPEKNRATIATPL